MRLPVKHVHRELLSDALNPEEARGSGIYASRLHEAIPRRRPPHRRKQIQLLLLQEKSKRDKIMLYRDVTLRPNH